MKNIKENHQLQKKVPFTYKIVKKAVRTIVRKYEEKGIENLPEAPFVLVGNHSQMYGPIVSELYITPKHKTWCAAEMMDRKEVAEYAFNDFWSRKPKSIRWFYKILSRMIPSLAAFIFNNAETVAVHHNGRVVHTFKNTVKYLQEGISMVIFPEKDEEYNHILYEFQDGFVDIARLYHKKTGKELKFVPMYIAPELKKIYYGIPISYNFNNDIVAERERICKYIQNEITTMAKNAPLHTVIPYRNIKKKDYPKNRGV